MPLSGAPDYWIAGGDPDLGGWPVIGADGAVAGTIVDLWIDKADRLVQELVGVAKK